MHGANIGVVQVSVSWEHPLKVIVQQLLHRAGLFGPRIPGDAAKSGQRLTIGRPGQVIAGEQKLVAVKKDDVADHRLFREQFDCRRVMHADDGAERLGVEQIIRGSDPVRFDNELLAIPTPGHTRGHVVFLYRNKFLFTGDHLAWSPNRQTLTAFRSVAWYSWPEQIRSMEKLLDYDFEWVLPGHGDMHHADVRTMHDELARCVAWMKTK